jgi:hypothetical protein
VFEREGGAKNFSSSVKCYIFSDNAFKTHFKPFIQVNFPHFLYNKLVYRNKANFLRHPHNKNVQSPISIINSQLFAHTRKAPRKLSLKLGIFRIEFAANLANRIVTGVAHLVFTRVIREHTHNTQCWPPRCTLCVPPMCVLCNSQHYAFL